jgi:hypothetical protein
MPDEICTRCKVYYANKEKQTYRKLEHKCYDCGKEVKPILKYPSRCECCKQKIKTSLSLKNEKQNLNTS